MQDVSSMEFIVGINQGLNKCVPKAVSGLDSFMYHAWISLNITGIR